MKAISHRGNTRDPGPSPYAIEDGGLNGLRDDRVEVIELEDVDSLMGKEAGLFFAEPI
jgi:hypothetical protein